MAQLGATGYANQWRSQVYSNLRITQQIYKGLSVSGMFSFDTYNYTSNRFTKTPNTYHATGRDANGNLLYEQTRQGTENLAYSLSAKGNRAIYLEAAVNYRNTFGRHTVSGMMLFNQTTKSIPKPPTSKRRCPTVSAAWQDVSPTRSTTVISGSSTSDTTVRRTSPRKTVTASFRRSDLAG